ncbi:hypothetical protein P154DRAFT_443254 [Amniculicola lignicola CBS 123094]|uniref:Nudix hydrolase domain-containing protein n=1 Tax=Amniculicola lignicola CBS 123094 TaxID=1392246 RepID=A0A6A5W3R4_9PLEO|nr:hypothetical protein P154DRAFT_443254 [Amniculicola lignicola CBS 123094]
MATDYVHATSTYPATFGQFASEDFMIGGGVAIFHIATGRVVICKTTDRQGRTFYFLPKGRRDAGEESGKGAEREGYEESGYRNRLLPLPTKHRQPQAHPRITAPSMTAEPVWTQMLSMRHGSIQYIFYWYIAETLPPDLDADHVHSTDEAYKPPPPFPLSGLTLMDRVRMEPEGYEPVKHEGTGVDEDEQKYESWLVKWEEAVVKLGRGGVEASVVERGWRGIEKRFAMEEENSVDKEEA